MNRTQKFAAFAVGLLCLGGLFGCDQRPAVPTIAPEPTQPVVVIVVTATSQPTLAPTSTPEATITPIPTLTPVASQVVTVTATIPATIAVPATQAPPTAAAVQPTVEQPTAEAPAATAAPASFPAPQAIAPIDLFIAPGPAVLLQFTSVGPLAADQCYRFRMSLSYPGDPNSVDDYWVPQQLCGNQSNPGDVLTFELKSARFRDEPNYGGLLEVAETIIPPSPQYDMRWNVDVVRMVDATDPIHPTVEALSPASASLSNTFSR